MWLKLRDAESGIRDIEKIERWHARRGLALQQGTPCPRTILYWCGKSKARRAQLRGVTIVRSLCRFVTRDIKQRDGVEQGQ